MIQREREKKKYNKECKWFYFKNGMNSYTASLLGLRSTLLLYNREAQWIVNPWLTKMHICSSLMIRTVTQNITGQFPQETRNKIGSYCRRPSNPTSPLVVSEKKTYHTRKNHAKAMYTVLKLGMHTQTHTHTHPMRVYILQTRNMVTRKLPGLYYCI